MEKVNVDRKSFYEFLETLFNRIDPINQVALKVENKKGYRKIDNDYYKCKIEEYSLVYPDEKKVLPHNLISSAVKHVGYTIVERERKFDTSIITLDEIKSMINANYKNIPFLYRLPDIINSINIEENFDKSGVLVINDELKDILCTSIINYLKEEEKAFCNLQTDLHYIEESIDNEDLNLKPCEKVRGRRLF